MDSPTEYAFLCNAMPFLCQNRHVQLIVGFIILLASGYLAYVIRLDYQAFIALGPGGTPSTVPGYLKIKLLSLVRLRDPLKAPAIPPWLPDQSGHLSTRTLPYRYGPRPTILGLAPQRQIDSVATAKSYEQTQAAIHQLADTCSGLGITTSHIEKHSEALVAKAPVNNVDRGGEICHVHPSDGSLHLTLHPADVALCIERGWAERHPLARGGWMTRFVPETFVMVYAPRTEMEVKTTMEIVRAAVRWVAGPEGITSSEEGLGKRSSSGNS